LYSANGHLTFDNVMTKSSYFIPSVNTVAVIMMWCHLDQIRFVLRAMEHCLDRNFRRRTYVNKGPNIYPLSGKTKDYKIGTNDTVLLSCIKICCLVDRMMFPNGATSLSL
jgi:hypothetical protein